MVAWHATHRAPNTQSLAARAGPLAAACWLARSVGWFSCGGHSPLCSRPLLSLRLPSPPSSPLFFPPLRSSPLISSSLLFPPLLSCSLISRPLPPRPSPPPPPVPSPPPSSPLHFATGQSLAQVRLTRAGVPGAPQTHQYMRGFAALICLVAWSIGWLGVGWLVGGRRGQAICGV